MESMWLGRFSRALGLALLLAAPAAALDPRRPLELYDLEVWRDGLPQYTVQSLLQTSDGYLWIGTIEGLVRFNGVSFEVFDRQKVPAISNWRVRALCEEPPGTLWIGTSGGGLIRYRRGAFSRFGKDEGLAGDDVEVLAPARGGGVWIGTSTGLSRWRAGRLESWGEPGGPVIHALLEESDGTLLLGTEAGLVRFDGARFFPEPFGAERGPPPSVSSLARHDGDLLIGTIRDGLFRLRGGRAERLAPRWASALLTDREGSVWAATTPGGLLRMRGDSWETLDRARGLPSDTVRAILEDREGCLWIGTAGGLARLRDLKFVTYTRRNGLEEDNVRVVLEEPDGTIWVGTYGGGLARIRGGAVTSFGAAQGLNAAYVRTLARRADGTILVGTESGLYFLRGDRIVPSDVPELSRARVDALHARADGSVLVSAAGRGLCELRGGRFDRMPLGDPGATAGVRVICEAPDGRLWLGTADQGLLESDGRRILRKLTKRDGLPDDAVFALQCDPDGTLWVGTHEGLSRIRGDRVDSVGAPALPQPTVFQILDDGRGSFWLTSHHGVTRVDRRSVADVLEGRARRVRAELFGRKDGLGNDQCNGATQPAGVRLRDGTLAIPTLGGLTIIDPADLHRNAVPPPIVLTESLADGRPFPRMPVAALSWRSRRLEFRYDGLSLLAPALVGFRFRMEGFDPDWIDAGTRRSAFYASLPPGRYVFRVQAKNNDGVWSEESDEVSFEIATAPWRRWWAMAGYLAAAAAAIGASIRMRERTLRRRNALLEARVRERTAELAEANRQLETLSRTDALTGVANRRRFDELFDLEWRRAARGDRRLAVIAIDVDRFKAYNDAYGHPAGDECLQAVAGVLQRSLTRGSDLLARYGGEEFVVLLPSTTLAEAVAHAERLRKAVEALQRVHPGGPAGVVTISLGVASLDARPEPGTPAELIAAADLALYKAKGQGRNCVEPASEG